MKDGFSAAKREDEKLCPGMQAEILDSIADVTDRVSNAAKGKTGQDFVKARDAEIAAIEKEGCAGREATNRCQVITLYQGGQYKLYTYRKYSDVRLVFAPEQMMAFFGGDPDNFNFPRYDLDCSFVRLYENGKPVATPAHLKWRTDAPKEGEPVFVAGNPGTTNRLFTAEQLETIRDVTLPDTLVLLRRTARPSDPLRRGKPRTRAHLERGSVQHREQLQGPITARKKRWSIRRSSPPSASPMPSCAPGSRRTRSWRPRSAIRGRISRSVQADRRALYQAYTYMEPRAGLFSDLFGYGRAIVRAAEEKAKPNSERLPEYTDSRLALLEKRVLDNQPVYPELEAVLLEFWLTKLREHLTADARRDQDLPRQGIARGARQRASPSRSSPIRPIASNCGMADWRPCRPRRIR